MTEDKPYGYVRADGEGLFIFGEHQFQNITGAELVPIYLHPKEWVGLTLEEILDTYRGPDGSDYVEYARGLEAKLKEKNT